MVEKDFPMLKSKMEQPTGITAIGSGIINIISSVEQRAGSCASGVVFNVQDCVRSFTGREDVIRELHEATLWKTGKTPEVVSQTVAICGMGGMGKSETVRQYIRSYKDSYTHILWINAGSYSEAKTCFINLARRLDMEADTANWANLEDKQLAEKVYSHLKQPTLVVFDNVQKEYNEGDRHVRVFFPGNIENKNCTIILTTRERKWYGETMIELCGLSHEECYHLLITCLQLASSEQNYRAALEIHKLCEGLPIVLQQVIAMIKAENKFRHFLSQTEYSLQEYVRVVKTNFNKLIKTRPADSPVGDSVYTIFQITFNALQNLENGKLALHCLDVMSLLKPDIPIPLVRHLMGAESDEKFAKSISLLVEHNLIKQECRLLKVHRMVQVIRKQTQSFLSETDIEPRLTLLSKISHRIFSKPPSRTDLLNTIFHHFTKFLKQMALNDDEIHCVLDNGIGLQDSMEAMKDVPDAVTRCEFTKTLAEKLQTVGRYNESKTLFGKLLSSQKSTGEINVEEAFMTEISIARLLNFTKDYQAAESLVTFLLYIHKNLIMSRIKMLDAQFILGDANFHQGKYEQAEEMYSVVLQEREKLLGARHPDTLLAKHNLALVYRNQGEFDRAEKIIDTVLQEQEKLLGKSHYDTLNTKHNLAVLFQNQGKFDRAQEMYDFVLQAQEKLLGNNHPETLRTRQGLAELFRIQGKYERAEELYPLDLQEPDSGTFSSMDDSKFIIYTSDELFRDYVDVIEDYLKSAETNVSTLEEFHQSRSSKTIQKFEAKLKDKIAQHYLHHESKALYRRMHEKFDEIKSKHEAKKSPKFGAPSENLKSADFTTLLGNFVRNEKEKLELSKTLRNLRESESCTGIFRPFAHARDQLKVSGKDDDSIEVYELITEALNPTTLPMWLDTLKQNQQIPPLELFKSFLRKNASKCPSTMLIELHNLSILTSKDYHSVTLVAYQQEWSDYIAGNMLELVNCTIVTPVMLVLLSQTGLISQQQHHWIRSKTEDNTKAEELYKLLQELDIRELPKLIKILEQCLLMTAAQRVKAFVNDHPSFKATPNRILLPPKMMTVPNPIMQLGIVSSALGRGAEPDQADQQQSENNNDEVQSSSGGSKEDPDPGRHFESALSEIEKKYEKSPTTRGLAIIVNMINFPGTNLETRLGAEKDSNELTELFRSLNFYVSLIIDLSSDELYEEMLYRQDKDYSEIDSLVVVVMSHGRGEYISGSDGKLLNIWQHIVLQFNNLNCEGLKDKPKIFIFNYCRGLESDQGVERISIINPNVAIRATSCNYSVVSDVHCDSIFPIQHFEMTKIPSWTDMLVCFSTLHDHPSFRDELLGAWFIQIFCHAVGRMYEKMDIISILGLVSEVLKQYTTEKLEKQICPYYNIGFNKEYSFRPTVQGD